MMFVQYLIDLSSETGLIDTLLMTTSLTPIIFYRFHINEFFVLPLNWLIQLFFIHNWEHLFEQTLVLLQNYLVILLLKTLPTILTRCFTFTELSILLQCQNYLLLNLIRLGRNLLLKQPNYLDTRYSTIVVMTCFIALYTAVISTIFLRRFFILKTLWFTFIIPLLTYLTFLFMFNIEIVQWLIAFITLSPQRVSNQTFYFISSFLIFVFPLSSLHFLINSFFSYHRFYYFSHTLGFFLFHACLRSYFQESQNQKQTHAHERYFISH